MAKKRTVMYSKGGKKLYAVRDAQGEFTDIQSYQRAQADDMRHKSKAELAKKAAKPAAGKPEKAMATKPATKAKPKAAKKKTAKRGK
ncbi:MAG TPA: hypothetical protein VGJ15_01640 [Pirellulales bacterium]